MASINFNPFNNNWFNNNNKPFQPINLLPHFDSFKPQQVNSSPFASISNPFRRKPKSDKPGHYQKMLEQYYWECETRPDFRHAPKVEKILNEDPLFEKKENPSVEEVEENDKLWSEIKESPVVQFMVQAEEIADKLNEMELQENTTPFRSEDKELWQAVPNVIGLDGRPMPRKSIKTQKESDDKFWDFTKHFFFGLWGFKQRPYPPGRPIDAAQAIGYKRLEDRYYDFIMRSGGWYYKDRLGRTRGPMELIQLKTAWGGGIIDKHTFIWGEDMDEWAPIGMVYGLEKAIATWEVRLGAAATAFLHKLQKGIPPWVPHKGHEPKTYKQMQEEAYEGRRRDLAVLKANDGVWPGVRIPSHAHFLWASGSELTSILEADHMPNKYIPKDLRKELQKVLPRLRPWQVLSVEQAMDQITYEREWYREPLGSFTTGPPYIRRWNRDVLRFNKVYLNLTRLAYNHLRSRIPGFDKIMEKVAEFTEALRAEREEVIAAKKRALRDKAFGITSDDDEK